MGRIERAGLAARRALVFDHHLYLLPGRANEAPPGPGRPRRIAGVPCPGREACAVRARLGPALPLVSLGARWHFFSVVHFLQLCGPGSDRDGRSASPGCCYLCPMP